MASKFPKEGGRTWRAYAERRLTESEAAELSDACASNARALLAEAKVLLENGGSERSYYLACIAMEEVGKSLFLGGILALMGLGEPVEDRFWVLLWWSWSDHPSKLQPSAGFDQVRPALDAWLEGQRAELEAGPLLDARGILAKLGAGTLEFAARALTSSVEPARAKAKHKLETLYVDWHPTRKLQIPRVEPSEAEALIETGELHLLSAVTGMQMFLSDSSTLRWFATTFKAEFEELMARERRAAEHKTAGNHSG